MSDYVPIEYPKWLRGDGQPDTLVQDAAEEKRVLASWRKGTPAEPPPDPEQPIG